MGVAVLEVGFEFPSVILIGLLPLDSTGLGDCFVTCGTSDVGDVAVAMGINGIYGRFLGGVSNAGDVAGDTGTNGTSGMLSASGDCILGAVLSHLHCINLGRSWSSCLFHTGYPSTCT